MELVRSKSERDESARSVSLETLKKVKNTKLSAKMLQAEEDDAAGLLILGEEIEPENFDLN